MVMLRPPRNHLVVHWLKNIFSKEYCVQNQQKSNTKYGFVLVEVHLGSFFLPVSICNGSWRNSGNPPQRALALEQSLPCQKWGKKWGTGRWKDPTSQKWYTADKRFFLTFSCLRFVFSSLTHFVGMRDFPGEENYPK